MQKPTSQYTSTLLAHSRWWGGLLVLIGTWSMACSSLPSLKPSVKPVYFKHQEEAGSVQVGVQSVAPFEEYVDSLQPRFTLTEQAAFDTAIAQSQIEDLREMRALLAKIAVALPSTTKNVEEVLTRTNTTEESSRTETTKETPPTASAASAPAVDSTLAGVPAAPTGNVAIDAALRYRAAAALFQDVALLSSYVREAAVGPKTTPYIVRLLVTVLPSARTAPYDAYATVSFFLDAKGSPVSYLVENQATNWSNAADAEFNCNGKEVQVIPLFVTDNLESTATSSARESVSGFDASAGGVVSNVGIGGGVASKADASLGTRSIDLSGIQTLAVTSRNTIQVRLGAASAQGGYRAVPRTYNLTALILVPSKTAQTVGNRPTRILACESLRYFAQSSFRETVGGALLPVGARTEFAKSLDSLLRNELGLGEEVSLVETVAAAQQLDYDAFDAALKKEASQHATSAPALWPAVANLVSSRGISRGSFPLPKSLFRFFPVPTATDPKVPILDDGKAARATLYGAQQLETKFLSAKLSLHYDGTAVQVDSTGAVVTPDRRGATFTFPSMKAFLEKIVAPAGVVPPKSASLTIDYEPTLQRWSTAADQITWRWEQQGCPIILTKEEEKPRPVPEFELRSTADFIRARKDGTGELALEIKKTGKVPRKVFFRVSGGMLAGVAPDAPFEGAYRAGETDKAYVLSLKNLIAGRTVTVSSWRMEGDAPVNAPDVSLFVVPEPETPAGRGSQEGRPTTP